VNVSNCISCVWFKYEIIVGGVFDVCKISREFLSLKSLKIAVSSFLNYFSPVEIVKNKEVKRLFFIHILLENLLYEKCKHKKTALNFSKRFLFLRSRIYT